MSRVQAVSKFVFKPEHADEALAAMQVLETESVKEEGCIEYRCLQDIKEVNVFHIICAFDDKEALDVHEESAHSKAFGASVGKYITSVEGSFLNAVNGW